MNYSIRRPSVSLIAFSPGRNTKPIRMTMKFITVKLLIAFTVLSASVFSQGSAKLPESPIKTVYLVPFSHYDFGFVEPPDAVRERAARHIDEVIRVAEENPNF